MFFEQSLNLVFPEWYFVVPNAVSWSSSMIDAQVKRAVRFIHFCWTVTPEFLVIINWTSFVVCCLSGWIKCLHMEHLGSSLWFPNQNFVASFAVCLKNNVSPFEFSSWAQNPKWSANNHQTVRWSASGFSSPNSLLWNNKFSSASDTSFAARGWFPFASSKTSCFYSERRTSRTWECLVWSSCCSGIAGGFFEAIVELLSHTLCHFSSSPSESDISRYFARLQACATPASVHRGMLSWHVMQSYSIIVEKSSICKLPIVIWVGKKNTGSDGEFCFTHKSFDSLTLKLLASSKTSKFPWLYFVAVNFVFETCQVMQMLFFPGKPNQIT